MHQCKCGHTFTELRHGESCFLCGGDDFVEIKSVSSRIAKCDELLKRLNRDAKDLAYSHTTKQIFRSHIAKIECLKTNYLTKLKTTL